MSNSHEESLPQYYNYTNKGQTYQFDLTQLTPEERKRFMKLNERQKMKIITLMDLKDDGKMKNEHDLRPAYIDEDENRRENDLRTLTAKKEATEQLIEELKESKDKEKKKLTLSDEALYKIIESNPEYALITKTDIDKIKAVNPTATPETLKKYYEELIKDLKVEGESFRVKKAIMGHPLTSKAMQAKPELLKKLFSETNDLLSLLINNTQFLYPQPRNVKLSPEDRVKQEETQEAQKILAENIPEILDIKPVEFDKIIKSPEKLKEMKVDIDNFIKSIGPIDEFEQLKEMPEPTYTTERKKKKPIETGYDPKLFISEKEYNDVKNILDDVLKNPNPDEKMKNVNHLISDLATQFNINVINDDDISGVYTAVKNISANRPYAKGMYLDKAYYPSGTKNKDKERITAFTSTMDALGDENEEFKNIFDSFVSKRIETNIPYKSGSIKDRVWKIFHPNAERFKNYQVEAENTKDELTKAKSDIELLKNEIKDLKKEIQNISSSKEQPEKEPVSRSGPSFLEPKRPGQQSFLNEITKPQNLRKIENSPPSKTDSSDDGIESDLRNAMIRRREDIAPDSEDEDDSEEWGEGIKRFNNPCGRAGKMKLSDYLRKM